MTTRFKELVNIQGQMHDDILRRINEFIKETDFAPELIIRLTWQETEVAGMRLEKHLVGISVTSTLTAI